MDNVIVKDGKSLRMGYTTGSCAAAAAKAAALMLLTGRRSETIQLQTPKGILLDLPVTTVSASAESVTCAVRKDSGDDPDVTNGTLILAEVSLQQEPGIMIDGGQGIGRVTKPGLDQPVGAAAINSVPRQMIRENLEEVCLLTDHTGGLSVIISAPEGKALAQKTFNPRLGITGGISILGTSGIVEPMSEQALVDTIRVELNQRKAVGEKVILLTPGNYGLDFIRGNLPAAQKKAVMTSNFIGDALDTCKELDFSGVLLVGHIGKLVKLAGGMLNTHSRYGDCRMEILAAYAGAEGLYAAGIDEILDCAVCDDAVRIMKENDVLEKTMERLISRISFILEHRTGGHPETGVILFSNTYGILGKSGNADALLDRLRI